MNRFDGADELLEMGETDQPEIIPEAEEQHENSLFIAQNSSIDGTAKKSNSGAGSLIGQNVILMDDPFNGRTNLFKNAPVGRMTEKLGDP